MANSIRKAGRIAFFATVVLQCSCIDEGYDLSDVDTDDITIGNELTLPLGTGVISAGDIINIEDNEEIRVDAAGNYVAAYAGEIEVDTPNQVGFENSVFPVTELNIPLQLSGSVVYPEDDEIDLGEESCSVDFATADIARLDSVLFDNSNGTSLLYFTLSVDGLRINSGEVDLVFKASFPSGYRLVPRSAQDGSFSDGEYTCTVSGRELAENDYSKTIVLSLQKAVIGSDDKIVYGSSLRIKKGASLSAQGSPRLTIAGGIDSPDFKVVYGLIDDQFSAGQVSISTKGLDDLFEGDNNVLSFADPRILLTAKSDIGIPLKASFSMTSVNDRTGVSKTVSAENIAVEGPKTYGQTATSNIWLGAAEEGVPADYVFTRCAINDLIKISPDEIRIGTNVQTDLGQAGKRACFYPKGASAVIAYKAEIPLAPAADFRGQTDQVVEDVFDEDLVSYLFSSGTVEIYGSVTNSLPLNFKMNLIVTDAQDNPVGIDFTPQQVLGGGQGADGAVSKVSFTIAGADMPKMKTARNLRIRLEAYCDGSLAGKSLRPDQQAKLDLKIRKSGGINISTND